jgi:hypothetical protein
MQTCPGHFIQIILQNWILKYIWPYFYYTNIGTAMEGNINHELITSYSKEVSTKLMNDFFKQSSAIKGQQILQFCEVSQINFFIVKTLFENWKVEFDKLRSPYFDYQSEEVLMAARKFMNVLSKKILIQKDDFSPLLEAAVYKTVLLIFSPYEYYLQEINKPVFQQISIADLSDIQKYIKINGHLLQAYIDRFRADGIQAVFNDDAVRIFDEVCENIKGTPEDFEVYHKQLNKISPLDINTLYSNSENVSDEFVEDNKPAESENINEKFKTEKKTLLDTLPAGQKEKIVDVHEKKPLDGIRQSITINQRFMFEKELFSSDKDEFEMVINYLDNCKSKQEAMEFVNENYALKKKWDMEKEEVVEFFEIINKRFP